MYSIVRRSPLEILFQVVNDNRLSQISANQSQIFDRIVILELTVLSCEYIIFCKKTFLVNNPQEIVGIFSRCCSVQNQLIVFTHFRQKGVQAGSYEKDYIFVWFCD